MTHRLTEEKLEKQSELFLKEDEKDPGDVAALIRESTDIEDLLMLPAVNTTNTGLDTLEEEEEKARFFAQLETGASSTIDYSKLNRDLDSTSSTIGSNFRKLEEAVELNDDAQRKANFTETIRESPDLTGSPHYCEDSVKDENAKEPMEEKSKMSPLLPKGPSSVQSGGTEMEALHEAYRQIHVEEDSGDLYHQYSSLEGRGRTNMSVSPSSPPQYVTQPASTAESELPTAEELMKPVRPEMDYIRGSTLQPVSAAELHQDNTSHFLKNTLTDLTSEEAHPVAGIKEIRRLSSPNPPNNNLSIEQEVERLMQDQDKYLSPISSQAGKTRKQQGPHWCTVSHPSMSSVRKPSGRGRGVEGRTAVTSTSTGPSRAATQTLTKPSVSLPLQHPQGKEPGVKVSSELVASAQSSVAASGTQEGRTHHSPMDNREEDGALINGLRVQLAQKEKELQMMKDGAEELNSLRQQNYLLQSKLQCAQEACQRKRWGDVTDSAKKETLQQMDKEMKKQEELIQGYQQENERLYFQMKALQNKSKAMEEAMFNENQKLMNELVFTRELLNKNSRPVGNVYVMDQTQHITDLAQINKMQLNEAKLSEEIHQLKQEKQSLGKELQLIKEKRHQAVAGDKALEICALEERHREEMASLKNKLQWFAENQELLDRDADRLKAAIAEIYQLKEQVEKLKMELTQKSCEKQRKAKEKTANTKRMQDLERQVKELEQILRNRNPNSLPALIYAATTAGHQEDVETSKTSPSSSINALQERRIQRLEAELESHDEEAKRSLRVIEQQFHKIKLRYEQQISELEQQLEHRQHIETADSAAESKPRTPQVQMLEEDLQRLKETHQEKERALLDQIGSLQQQLRCKANPSPGRRLCQCKEAFSIRLQRLNKELSVKTKSIQELNRTVDRLQKERRNTLSGPNLRPDTQSTESKAANTPCSDSAVVTCGGGETSLAGSCEKIYQPTLYTGSHISEVLQENEALKQRLEQMELQSEQNKEALKAEAVQTREELLRQQEHYEEQLSSLKAEHLRLSDQLCATHALEHSSSKVAKLANKLSSQEITVKHLQDQLGELQGTKDALAISRTREDALQKQLTRLLKELKEAKEAQSPEVNLMCRLERRILNLDLRHQHREKELQRVIAGSRQMLHVDQQSEVEHWKRVARDQSRDLEAFRLELESILDILRHLHRQRVICQV